MVVVVVAVAVAMTMVMMNGSDGGDVFALCIVILYDSRGDDDERR